MPCAFPVEMALCNAFTMGDHTSSGVEVHDSEELIGCYGAYYPEGSHRSSLLKSFGFIVKVKQTLDGEPITIKSKQCDFCQTLETAVHKLKMCAQCETCRYCNIDCQRSDWRQGHKEDCQEFKFTKEIMGKMTNQP